MILEHSALWSIGKFLSKVELRGDSRFRSCVKDRGKTGSLLHVPLEGQSHQLPQSSTADGQMAALHRNLVTYPPWTSRKLV